MARRPVRNRLALAALAAAGTITAASAQVFPPDESLIRFGRYTAVRERTPAGFQAPGLPLGSFTLFPTVETSLSGDDNIFALDAGEVADAFVRVSPALEMRSNWATRTLSINASGQLDRYMDRDSENRNDLNLSAYGTQQFGDSTRLRLVTRYRNQRESRDSQNVFVLTERPIRFDALTGGIAASHRLARVLLSGEAAITRSNFDDGTRMVGGILDQDFRDNDLVRLRARAEIAQTASLAYFAQYTFDDRTFRVDTALNDARRSNSHELLGGVRFELPILMRGEIGAGYIRSESRGDQFRTFSGLALNGQVLFFPTELTTVTVGAQRSISDTGTLLSSGFDSVSGRVRVDHELLRTLIISANAQVQKDTFNGIDRDDTRTSVGASLDYRFNPALSLRVTYDRLDLSSNGVDRYKSFAANRVLVGVGLRK